ncbi:MAG TPA: hypothetical protein VFZ34_21725 [Blastocatellia bacterium]|nr:hypothetical protein [Blastocatellia bacterium]
MSSVMVPQKAKEGWVIELAPDFAEKLGVAIGSIALLNVDNGMISYEILPPPTPEMELEFQTIYADLKDTFAEMKRLGD